MTPSRGSKRVLPKADRTPQGTETQAEADRRADDQDAAVEAAFLAGSLPEEDRRASETEETVPAVAPTSDEPEPDGSALPHPLGIVDAGAALHRDNATTPSVKEGQSTPPNPAGEQLKELEANG